VKTCHYIRHAGYYSTTDPPRGRIQQVSYPKNPGARPCPFPVNPPRPGLDQPPVNKEARPTRHRTWGLFTVSSFTSPWCPNSTALDKTSLLRHPSASLPPLDPIKGKAGDSTKGKGRKEKEKPSHHPTVEDQHLKQSPLYSHFLFET
jgi:hypothetical protein